MQEDLNLWPQFHRLKALRLLPLCPILLHPFPPKTSFWVIQISSQNTDLFSLFAQVSSNQNFLNWHYSRKSAQQNGSPRGGQNCVLALWNWPDIEWVEKGRLSGIVQAAGNELFCRASSQLLLFLTYEPFENNQAQAWCVYKAVSTAVTPY